MRGLTRLVSSFFPATTPITDIPLSRLLKSRSNDRHFVKRVKHVVFSRNSLVAAQILSPADAQKVINKLDKALDIPAIVANERFWRRCLRYLCRISGRHRLLPVAYKLTPTKLRMGNKPIGSGGFAEVWKGSYNGQQVAIKILKVYSTSKTEDVGRRFCREVLMWNRRPHPNILPLIGVLAPDFIMVSEWMENGNIREYVTAHPRVNRPLTLLGAIDGLIFLHSRNLVHGDLKGPNILIKQDGSSCLADFGFATIMPTETSSFLFPPSIGGTTRWMSPELLNPDERHEPLGRTVCSDRYAFGMVIYEVLTGDVPFRQIPDQAVITRVLRGSRPEIPVDTSAAAHRSGLWEIVQQCWEQSPMERPALPAVRDRLSVAAGMWDVNLGQSGTIDGFVDVDPCILLESDDSSDAESDNELGPGMSRYSLIQCSCVLAPDDEEGSESDLEPPDFVYAKPKS